MTNIKRLEMILANCHSGFPRQISLQLNMKTFPRLFENKSIVLGLQKLLKIRNSDQSHTILRKLN